MPICSGGNGLRVDIPRIGVYITPICKDRSSKTRDDRKGQLCGSVDRGTTTDRISVKILGTNTSVDEAAHVVGTTKVEFVEDRWSVCPLSTTSPSIYHTHGTLCEENHVPRKRKIFLGIERDAVILDSSAKPSSSHESCQVNRLPLARKKQTVAVIKIKPEQDATLGVGGVVGSILNGPLLLLLRSHTLTVSVIAF